MSGSQSGTSWGTYLKAMRPDMPASIEGKDDQCDHKRHELDQKHTERAMQVTPVEDAKGTACRIATSHHQAHQALEA